MVPVSSELQLSSYNTFGVNNISVRLDFFLRLCLPVYPQSSNTDQMNEFPVWIPFLLFVPPPTHPINPCWYPTLCSRPDLLCFCHIATLNLNTMLVSTATEIYKLTARQNCFLSFQPIQSVTSLTPLAALNLTSINHSTPNIENLNKIYENDVLNIWGTSWNFCCWFKIVILIDRCSASSNITEGPVQPWLSVQPRSYTNTWVEDTWLDVVTVKISRWPLTPPPPITNTKMSNETMRCLPLVKTSQW